MGAHATSWSVRMGDRATSVLYSRAITDSPPYTLNVGAGSK
jgi:hypothetical protein